MKKMCECCGEEIKIGGYMRLENNSTICWNCRDKFSDYQIGKISYNELVSEKTSSNLKQYFQNCSYTNNNVYENHVDEVLCKNILLTPGYNIEGYKILKYLGYFSAETALGTGFLSSLDAGISDFLGKKSVAYSKKISTANDYVINELIRQVKDCRKYPAGYR